MSHPAACNLWHADRERGGERRGDAALGAERESTKTTINIYESIAIAEGDAACGWCAERVRERK